jgi:hypothetical protein
MRAVSQDQDPVDRQARFRVIQINELIDGVTIAAKSESPCVSVKGSPRC